jgi:tryptophan synthase alpha chain
VGELKNSTHKIGLMGHVVAGYPSLAASREMIQVIAGEGAEIIEIQIPFSEPMADGPLFVKANQEALAAGIKVKDALQLMSEVSKAHPNVAFVFMTYLNVVYRFRGHSNGVSPKAMEQANGVRAFVDAAKAAGARGVIIPDLPFEEAEMVELACGTDFANIRLVTPTSTSERLAKICRSASGIVYAAARVGVTGQATVFGQGEIEFLGRVQQALAQGAKLPLAVGFGITSGKDVEFLINRADFAVVGSQSLREYQAGGAAGLKAFWQGLHRARSI